MLVVSVFVGVAAMEAGEKGGFGAPRPSVLSVNEAAAARPLLRLAWLDLAGVPTDVEAIAQKEAGSVMEEMGLEARWRRARTPEAAREGEIRVVLVDRLLVDPETKQPVLGATASESRTFPVVWVHLAGVRATLGHSPRSPGASGSFRERRDLGLAVGRVMAHEVVHVAAPSLSHGRGLMSRAFSRHALTSPRISFEPGVAVEVRASLRGALAPVGAPSGILAAAGSIVALREPAPCKPTGMADRLQARP